jgi:histidine ammonia-lyase
MSIQIDACSYIEIIRLAEESAATGTSVGLSPHAWDRIRKANQALRQIALAESGAYGISTGVGALLNQAIRPEDETEYQKRLLRSHAAGTGPLLDRETVALMLLLRIRTISKGWSGTAPEHVKTLLALIESGILPEVPSRGSVGASGDLAPLAHAMLPLIGEGICGAPDRTRFIAGEALAACGCTPHPLRSKDALSLINGTALSAALLFRGFRDLTICFNVAVATSALLFHAVEGRTLALDDRIARLQGHPSTIVAAGLLRRWLCLPQTTTALPQQRGQDPYSIRCCPQILGAILAEIEITEKTIGEAIDGVSDNPLIDAAELVVLQGGNFHGLALARAADRLSAAAASLGALQERQVALLIDGKRSGLPDFLTEDAGLNSGLMMHHVAAAALTAELRLLAVPASTDSIPTSNDQEDIVPMAPLAGLRLRDAIERLLDLLVIALHTASQACHFAHRQPSKPLESLLSAVRRCSPVTTSDRVLLEGLRKLREWIRTEPIELRGYEFRVQDYATSTESRL